MYSLHDYNRLGPDYTLFADVASRLGLSLEPIRTNLRFGNTVQLAFAVHDYMCMLYEDTGDNPGRRKAYDQ